MGFLSRFLFFFFFLLAPFVGGVCPSGGRFAWRLTHGCPCSDEWDEIERDWDWIKVMLLPRLVGLEMGHADKLRYILVRATQP